MAPMDPFRLIAERRIKDAIDEGLFDDLPLRGRRLHLDDMRDVPEELRAAYRLLRNANVLPREVDLHNQIQELRRQLRGCAGPPRHLELRRRLNELETQFSMMMESRRRGL